MKACVAWLAVSPCRLIQNLSKHTIFFQFFKKSSSFLGLCSGCSMSLYSPSLHFSMVTSSETFWNSVKFPLTLPLLAQDHVTLCPRAYTELIRASPARSSDFSVLPPDHRHDDSRELTWLSIFPDPAQPHDTKEMFGKSWKVEIMNEDNLKFYF